jgi:hypothetical protein
VSVMARAGRQAKRPESKLCPTCWNDMRLTTDGYVCPRHGLIETRPAPPVVERRASSHAPSVKRERHPRPKVARPPRQPSQTDRLIAMRDKIIARNHAGESIAAIALDLWQELGYANAYVCANKISLHLSSRGISPAARRPGPPPGAVAVQRFTPERLTQLRAALADGASVWAFAGAHWQEWGFPSRSSCDSLLRKWLRTKATA